MKALASGRENVELANLAQMTLDSYRFVGIQCSVRGSCEIVAFKLTLLNSWNNFGNL